MNIEKELSYKEFMMRENNNFHAPFQPEFIFYNAIKHGNLSMVSNLCENGLSNKNGLGKLSDNPLQNIKYHYVITVALVARYCIEGGMEHETSYNLSDLYIQRADLCTTINDISKLHTSMALDYTKRMKDLEKKHIISKHIVKSIEFIHDHLHTRIKIADLAIYTGINESYLSRLFKKEVGVTITTYIQEKKIETAKNMLRYSDYLPSQISNILYFPSQSYFIELFKKYVGMTPKHYQDMCFRELGIVQEKERV